MTGCDELRSAAAGIASLPEGDPERERYLAHARGCAACMEALREGERLMRALAGASLPAPSQEALRRARDPVLLALRPRARWWTLAPLVVPGFLLPLLFARHLDAQGWLAALVVLATAGALAATAGTLRGGALVTVAVAAAFAAAAGVPEVSFVPAHAVEVACAVLELVAAALPLAAAAWMARRDPRPGALAQAAAAGALAGMAALHLACTRRGDPVHLWVFHVGGVAAAALAGLLLQRQVSSARS